MKFVTPFIFVGLLWLAACAPAKETDEAVESAAVMAEARSTVTTTDTIPPAPIAATDMPTLSSSSEPTQLPTAATNVTTTSTDIPTITSTPAVINTPTVSSQPSPVPSATPGDQPSPELPAIVYGRTNEGAYFHGAADAPVTLLDYSDFL